MNGNVVDFSKYHRARPRRASEPVWTPEYGYRRDGSRGIPYWTGKEVLCKLVPNPDHQIGSREITFEYVTVHGPDGMAIRRNATPPTCPVDEYDLDSFEREAFRA